MPYHQNGISNGFSSQNLSLIFSTEFGPRRGRGVVPGSGMGTGGVGSLDPGHRDHSGRHLLDGQVGTGGYHLGSKSVAVMESEWLAHLFLLRREIQ